MLPVYRSLQGGCLLRHPGFGGSVYKSLGHPLKFEALLGSPLELEGPCFGLGPGINLKSSITLKGPKMLVLSVKDGRAEDK